MGVSVFRQLFSLPLEMSHAVPMVEEGAAGSIEPGE